jgi:hypothetical protein
VLAGAGRGGGGSVVAGCGAVSSTEPSGSPWAFVRIAGNPALGGPVFAGDEVLVGSTRRGRAMLTAFSPAGAARALSLPGSEASVSQLEASERAVAVTTGTSIATGAAAERSRGSVVPAGVGPRSGPLRTFSDVPAGVAVAGPYVLAFEDGVIRSVSD